MDGTTFSTFQRQNIAFRVLTQGVLQVIRIVTAIPDELRLLVQPLSDNLIPVHDAIYVEVV